MKYKIDRKNKRIILYQKVDLFEFIKEMKKELDKEYDQYTVTFENKNKGK